VVLKSLDNKKLIFYTYLCMNEYLVKTNPIMIAKDCFIFIGSAGAVFIKS